MSEPGVNPSSVSNLVATNLSVLLAHRNQAIDSKPVQELESLRTLFRTGLDHVADPHGLTARARPDAFRSECVLDARHYAKLPYARSGCRTRSALAERVMGVGAVDQIAALQVDAGLLRQQITSAQGSQRATRVLLFVHGTVDASVENDGRRDVVGAGEIEEVGPYVGHRWQVGLNMTP